MKRRIVLGLLIFALFASAFAAVSFDVTYAKAATKKIKWTNVKSKKTVYVGKTYRFKAKIYPKKLRKKRKVKYYSSKPRIATVSKKGVVKPLKNGKVTITAKISGKKGKKVKCRVTVKTKVSKITVSGEYNTCFVGKKLKLTKKVYPSSASNKDITWKSSNKTIATISSYGNVKGIKPGKVKITAYAKDGSGKKGIYWVTVRGSFNPLKDWFTAHRGYSAKYPENTVASVQMAEEEEFNSIEIDIHEVPDFYTEDEEGDLASRREFVIMHDSNIMRMCNFDVDVDALNEANIENYPIVNGNGNDKNKTYEIPTLGDYLDVMKDTDKKLYIELKDTNISEEGARQLMATLDEYGVAERTYIGSFYKNSLLTVGNIKGNAKLIRFINNNMEEKLNEEIDWCNSNKIDVVSLRYGLYTKTVAKKIADYGMISEAWVVDDPSIAADLMDMGVNRITTNTVLW